MSWSLNVEVDRKSTALVAIEEAAESYFASLDSDSAQEMHEQAAAAALAAITLLDVIGTHGPWFVSLNGHANPGHGKREGWSNDTVSVSVREQ